MEERERIKGRGLTFERKLIRDNDISLIFFERENRKCKWTIKIQIYDLPSALRSKFVVAHNLQHV